MTEALTVDQTLDCKGLLCPMPIVKLGKAIKQMDPGMVILLETTDPGSIPDVAAWSQSTGNPILSQDKVGPVMHFWIRKS
jgi:Predicted redox protein, regulator of disulfide bond formation